MNKVVVQEVVYMAIVEVKKIGNCTVYVDDSAYASLTPEELEKRKAEVTENVKRILLQMIEKNELKRLQKMEDGEEE